MQHRIFMKWRILFSCIKYFLNRWWQFTHWFSIIKIRDYQRPFFFVVYRCTQKCSNQSTGHANEPIRKTRESYDENEKPSVLPSACKKTPKRPYDHTKHSQTSKREERPPKCKRFDDTGHYPVVDAHPTRCKLEHCKLKSNVLCLKCNVHLCLKLGRNCFHQFHCENK